MFIVQPFDKGPDTRTINVWLSGHGAAQVMDDDLPALGVIVLDEKTMEGVAVGFLRLVEGRYGMIDSMVTNPHYPITTRSKAIDQVFEALIHSAANRGIKNLIGCSETGTAKRAQKKFGFIAVNQTLLVKTLDKPT